jgi:hypothetical protein
MVITNDQAWLSAIREVRNTVVVANELILNYFLLLILQDEEIGSNPEQLLEQVLAFHDIRIDKGQHYDNLHAFMISTL